MIDNYRGGQSKLFNIFLEKVVKMKKNLSELINELIKYSIDWSTAKIIVSYSPVLYYFRT